MPLGLLALGLVARGRARRGRGRALRAGARGPRRRAGAERAAAWGSPCGRARRCARRCASARPRGRRARRSRSSGADRTPRSTPAVLPGDRRRGRLRRAAPARRRCAAVAALRCGPGTRCASVRGARGPGGRRSRPPAAPPAQPVAARRLLAARRRALLRGARGEATRLLLEPGRAGRCRLDGPPRRARGGARRWSSPSATGSREVLFQDEDFFAEPERVRGDRARPASRAGCGLGWQAGARPEDVLGARPRELLRAPGRERLPRGSTWRSGRARWRASSCSRRGRGSTRPGSRRASCSRWRGGAPAAGGGGLGRPRLCAMDSRFETPIRQRRVPRRTARPGGALEAWAAREEAPWSDARAERRLARATFYFAEAQRAPGRRLGKHLLRLLSLLRVRLGFFALDLERVAVEASAVLRTGRARGAALPTENGRGPTSCAARDASRTPGGRSRATSAWSAVSSRAAPRAGDAEVDLEGLYLLPGARERARRARPRHPAAARGAAVRVALRVDGGSGEGPGAARAGPRGAARGSPLSRGTAQPPRRGAARCSTTTPTTARSPRRGSRCACRGATASPTRPASRRRCGARTARATAASRGWCARRRGATRACGPRSTPSPRRTSCGRTP